MLYFIGLGLADESDITVKGLDIVKICKRVYLEAYTSILLVEKEKLVSVMSRVFFTCVGAIAKTLNEADILLSSVGSILWPLCHPGRP